MLKSSGVLSDVNFIGTGSAITDSHLVVAPTNGLHTEATTIKRERDFDSSEGAKPNNIYFLLAISFGTLLLFSLLLIAVLCVR